MKYRIELVWNREFDYVLYRRSDDIKAAREAAISIRDSGDGARVKKVRIVENDTDKVIWVG